MKSLIKLLPVALGALVMASCSNNDVLDLGGQQVANYQPGEGEILVTIDENSDATRAAIGEVSAQESDVYNMYRSVFWREKDYIKVYDAEKWRPQYFKFMCTLPTTDSKYEKDKEYTKNNAGALPSVFKLDADLSPSGTETTQYVDGYAVFPASKYSVFQGEERDKLTFDYSSMRYWSWDSQNIDYSTTYPGGRAWYTEFPMWGNVDDSKLALKFLMGFLRIDLSGYKQIGSESRASLVIQASKQLAGDFVAENFNYEAKKAPLLVPTATPTTYTNLTGIKTVNTIADPKSRTATVDNDFTMVINLPVDDLKKHQGNLTNDIANHNVFFIPVPVALKNYTTEVVNGRTYNKFTSDGLPFGATADPYAIRVSLVYDNGAADDDIVISNPALYTAGGDVIFESESFDGIDKAGRYYNLDCLSADNVNTPYQLANLIKDLDKVGRKLTVDVKSTPIVKGNETPQDQNLFIGKLNHDITINLVNGIEKSAPVADHYNHAPALYITKSGPGKLTLNFNGGTAANYPAIVIRDNGEDTGDYTKIKSSKVESDIVIGGSIKLPKVIVENASNVVTLKAAAELVNLKGKMTIDAKDLLIDALNVKSDGSEIKLLNGTITTMLHKSNEALSVNSEGKSFIKTIDNPTTASVSAEASKTWEQACAGTYTEWAAADATPANKYNKVTLNSIWDGNYATLDATNITAQQADIHTAAQFSAGAYVANSVLHTNMQIGTNDDATAAQKNWKGINLAQNFDGLEKNVELLTTNANHTNGLFAEIAPASADIVVKNLNLKANIQPSADVEKIGALAGSIDASAKKVTIFNVNLDKESQLGFTASKGSYTETKGSKIGGIAGYAKGNINIHSSSVEGQISGFAALGGYIGFVDAASTVQFGRHSTSATTDNDALGVSHAIAAYATPISKVTFAEVRTIGENLYNENYGTVGMFVGSVATTGAATVTIENASLNAGAPIIDNDKIAGKETALKFNKNHYKVGTDSDGNDMYYNYFGSKYNVVGYCKTDGTMPTIKIGYGFNVDFLYHSLVERKTNATTGNAATWYYNWFKPW